VWIGFTYSNIRWVVATIQLLICWFCLSRIFFTANWIPSKPAKFHVHHNAIRQVIMKSSIQTYIFQLQSNLSEEHSHELFLKCVIDHKLNQIRKLTRQVSTCHYPRWLESTYTIIYHGNYISRTQIINILLHIQSPIEVVVIKVSALRITMLAHQITVIIFGARQSKKCYLKL